MNTQPTTVLIRVKPLTKQEEVQKAADEFRKRKENERDEEIRRIGEMKKVSAFFGEKLEKENWKVEVIRVGVVFRTDQMGEVNRIHDLKAVEGMNELGLPFRVESVSLPRGASGPISPDRTVSSTDLDDIDILYIPGGSTANDTQTGATDEDANFKRPIAPVKVTNPGAFSLTKPVSPPAPKFNAEDKAASLAAIAKYKETPEYKQYQLEDEVYKAQREDYEQRKKDYDQFVKDQPKFERLNEEHTERSKYELDLIEMAKTRGIPMMAICAGSWRLLQSYGGEVRTLATEEREVHTNVVQSKPWEIGHGVKVESGSLLSGMMETHGMLEDVNSTHWAVATENASGQGLKKREGQEKDPNKLLEVTARTSGFTDPRELVPATETTPSITITREHEKTVEAFESRYGAPSLGLQWHPEGYLPDMIGENSGSKEINKGSRKLFKSMAQSAAAAQNRRRGLVPILQTK